MVSPLLSVEQAGQLVLESSACGPIVQIPLTKALGCVLATDVTASSDSPRFDKAMMDGFAVSVATSEARASSTSIPGQMRILNVIETVTAGRIPACAVTPGTAVRIMTGAEVPCGADCVVPIEQTVFDESQPDRVLIPEEVIRPESCIVRRGGIVEKGGALLSAGTSIYPPQIAALAEFGFAHISIFRTPTVAVLSTGDELVAVDQQPERGQIRNSNAPMLEAQIQQAGGHAVSLGIARDTATELSEKIHRGLESDILLLTGGVSAGMLDLVPAALATAGVQRIFHGVLLKPGKPLWFGVYESGQNRCLVFGLPGNPVSSLVCFELFVRIAINRLRGLASPLPIPFPGQLVEPVSITGNRPVYHPVRARLLQDRLLVSPVTWTGSSDLRATIEANAMTHLQPRTGGYQVGDAVDVWLWAGTALEDYR